MLLIDSIKGVFMDNSLGGECKLLRGIGWLNYWCVWLDYW